MLGFIILTVSNIEHSLAFYEAALKPLNIRYSCHIKAKRVILTSGASAMESRRSFGSSKGGPIQPQFIGASWPKAMKKSMSSTRLRPPPAPRTISRRGRESILSGILRRGCA